jgi:hypothetical protein
MVIIYIYIRISFKAYFCTFELTKRVHKFSWSGNYDQHKTKYAANKDNFVVLNLAPSQLYYNTDHVRTSDDALIEIKLMIFYELKDIDKMVY